MKYRKCSSLTRSAVSSLALFSTLLLSAAGETPVDGALQSIIIRDNVSAFNELPPIRFRVATATTYTEPYLKNNPNRANSDRMVSIYNGVIADGRYRVASTMTRSNGEKLPEFLITYDGEHYNYLNATGHPWILVSKRFVVDSCNALPLGTVAFLPYSFLFPTSDDYFVPNISIKRLGSNETWEEMFKSARLVDASVTGESIRIKFPHPNGAFYIVTFSVADGYIPTNFEKYGPGGLAQRYSVEATDMLLSVNKKSMRYPKKAKLETFLEGWPRNTITLDTTTLEIADKLDSIDFKVDPSAAESIFDADTNIRIKVPR